jgi:hypothetical protein
MIGFLTLPTFFFPPPHSPLDLVLDRFRLGRFTIFKDLKIFVREVLLSPVTYSEVKMKMRRGHWHWAFLLILVFSIGCAGIPVREAAKVDMKAPVGKIEGNQFTGIRYPFNVAAPPGWKVSTEYPKFMIDLGYEKDGLEESEVFLYNPETQSNAQIDFVAAGRYSTFDQKSIEALTTAATGSFEEELEKDLGKGAKAEIGPTKPVSLKGVPFAAQKYATYTVKGVQRNQGWIYAFAEPYQIFILYMILDKERKNDHEAFKAILDSFEYIPKK